MNFTPTLQLLRLDKPIGIWLLFFPAAWGVLLSPDYRWELLPIMLLGAVVTRSAGCIINDLTDRTLDAQVERTRSRPLASGALSVRYALGLLALLGIIALAIACLLPMQALLLSLLAVPMIATYPWMKRLTWWPQLFLGLTFNLGALIGWAATGAPLTAPAYLLYAACVCWTLGYDTIYAVQDMRDDAQVGIKSTARRVGARLFPFVAACYGVMFLMLLATYHTSTMHRVGLLGIAAAGTHALWQLGQVKYLHPAKAGALFCSNQWLGVLLLLGMACARL